MSSLKMALVSLSWLQAVTITRINGGSGFPVKDVAQRSSFGKRTFERRGGWGVCNGLARLRHFNAADKLPSCVTVRGSHSALT